MGASWGTAVGVGVGTGVAVGVGVGAGVGVNVGNGVGVNVAVGTSVGIGVGVGAGVGVGVGAGAGATWNPTTSTGVLRAVVVPSPSWPNRLLPQHLRPPAGVTAHVCLLPTETAATPLASPVTSTNVVPKFSLVILTPS